MKDAFAGGPGHSIVRHHNHAAIISSVGQFFMAIKWLQPWDKRTVLIHLVNEALKTLILCLAVYTLTPWFIDRVLYSLLEVWYFELHHFHWAPRLQSAIHISAIAILSVHLSVTLVHSAVKVQHIIKHFSLYLVPLIQFTHSNCHAEIPTESFSLGLSNGGGAWKIAIVHKNLLSFLHVVISLTLISWLL